MSSKSFSEMPWFVQDEIIDLVVSRYKEYRLLNRSWYRHTIAEHSDLHVSYVNKFSENVEKHEDLIRSVQLGTADDDQLNLLARFKNIRKLNLNVSYGCAEEPSLIDKAIVNLVSLKSLKISLVYDGPTDDFIALISNQCNSLQELVLCTGRKDHLKVINEEVFPNLISFSFVTCDGSFPITNFKACMPRFKKLLCSKEYHLQLPNQKLADLIELQVNVTGLNVNSVDSLDLSLFPSLVKVKFEGKFSILTPPDSHALRELMIDFINKSLRTRFYNLFSSLRLISVVVKNTGDDRRLHQVLNRATGLKILKLHYTRTFGWLSVRRKLAIGIDTLFTSGFLNLDKQVLQWASRCENLTRLDIDASCLYFEDPIESFNLNHIKFVDIDSTRTRNLNYLKEYFLANSQPGVTVVRVEFLILPKVCPGCSLIVH